MVGTTGIVARLRSERAQTLDQIESLARVVDGIVTAQAGSATDDEHDPEGQTIAFERAQAGALLQQARDRLAALDDALRRVDDDTYGRCGRCGQQIGPERLEALPAARLCITCASAGNRR